MFEKLESVVKRHEELTALLSDPAVLSDPDLLRQYAKEQVESRPIVTAYRDYRKVSQELQENQELLASEALDSEFMTLVREEITTLTSRLELLEQELRVLLLPQDPHDARSVIIEIRAGTGGDEAALFAADLFRMYHRYAEA